MGHIKVSTAIIKIQNSQYLRTKKLLYDVAKNNRRNISTDLYNAAYNMHNKNDKLCENLYKDLENLVKKV